MKTIYLIAILAFCAGCERKPSIDSKPVRRPMSSYKYRAQYTALQTNGNTIFADLRSDDPPPYCMTNDGLVFRMIPSWNLNMITDWESARTNVLDLMLDCRVENGQIVRQVFSGGQIFKLKSAEMVFTNDQGTFIQEFDGPTAKHIP